MAENRLLDIICNTSTGILTAGDLLEVYYDDTADEVVCYKNDVLQAFGQTILDGEVIDNTYSISGAATITDGISLSVRINYSFCSGVNLVSFNFENEFPYASKLEAFSEECSTSICDISKQGYVSITKASGIDQADGALSVSATTSNGTVKYALFDFDYSSQGQTSGTFSSLYPGDYKIYAKDSAGCTVSWNVTVGYERLIDYTLRFNWFFADLTSSTTNYKVELLKRNYSNSPGNEDVMGPVPVMRRLRGENSSRLQSVYPSEIEVTVQSDVDKEWLELFSDSDDREYLVKYYYDDGSGYDLIWQGFAITDLYTEPYEPIKYFSTFNATDGLADLKQEPFLDISGSPVFGDVSLLDILLVCLEKTGLEQSVRVGMSLYETGMDSTAADDPLDQVFVNTDTFYTEGEPDDCYTVLNKVLSGVNCKLFSYGGYWYVIYKPDQIDAFNYREFDANGSYVGNGSISPIIDLKESTESNRATWLTGGKTLQGEPVYKNININKLRIIPESITNSFTSRYRDGNTFVGWSKVLNGDTGSINVLEFTDSAALYSGAKIEGLQEGGLYFNFLIPDGQGANAYVVTTGSIEYKRGDTFRLSFPYTIRYAYGEPPPYIRLKIMLKVGSYYLQADGTWTTTENIISLQVNDFNREVEIEIASAFDYRVVDNTTSDYELRIYDVDVYDTDISVDASQSNMITALKAYSTTDLNLGAKITSQYTASRYIYYWELQDLLTGGNQSGYTPDDNASLKWVPIGVVGLPSSQDASRIFLDLDLAGSFLGSVQFITFPNGQALQPKDTEVITTNTRNVLSLDVDLSIFDLDTTVNNSENMVVNYLKLSDGTPTSAWGANGKNINVIIGDQIATWYNKMAYRIRGSIKADIHLPFYMMLREVSDDNRIYTLSSIDINDRDMKAMVEMVEVSSDSQVAAKAYSSGYSSGYA